MSLHYCKRRADNESICRQFLVWERGFCYLYIRLLDTLINWLQSPLTLDGPTSGNLNVPCMVASRRDNDEDNNCGSVGVDNNPVVIEKITSILPAKKPSSDTKYLQTNLPLLSGNIAPISTSLTFNVTALIAFT